MLENCRTNAEHWDGVDNLIKEWLNERQELIILYCSLSGVNKKQPNTEKTIAKLGQFCQLLLDYVSAGHFEIYAELLVEAESFADGSAETAKKLYPLISDTTQAALDFNDKYDTSERCAKALADVSADLSSLGELLVNRFEWEDQLIETTHYSHQALVA
jgi:regulator of sigma D